MDQDRVLRAVLARAGVLTELPVPGWVGSLLDLELLETPFPGVPTLPLEKRVVHTLGPVTVAATVRLDGDATSLTASVPLAGLSLDWGTGSATVTGATPGAALEVQATAAGVTCALPGSVTLTADGDPVELARAGNVVLAWAIDGLVLTVDDDAPHLNLEGTITLDGVDGLDARADVEVGWGPRGLTGSVSGTAERTAYAVSWSGRHDWRPDSLLLDVPLDGAMVPGTRPVAGRLRVLGRPQEGSPLGMRLTAEVLAPDDGLVRDDDPGVATAAVLIAACAGAEAGGGTGVVGLLAVVGAGQALGRTLGAGGHLLVTRAWVELTDPTRAVLDYTAALDCDFDAGIVAFGTTSPLRASVRGIALDWSDASDLRLDWAGATVELADPGHWEVERPDGLLQVDDVRSGNGSRWFELDLRFVLDLGPVEVQDATVRVQVKDDDIDVSVRGFGVAVTVPGLVSGSGRVAFKEPGGAFHAALRADLVPLNLKAAAALDLDKSGGYTSLKASLGVDLPAPVPLANTGLGLFGISGMLGINHDAGFGGTIEERLAWRPDQAQRRQGRSTVGLEVAVGTLPDLGHGFSAVGRLAVTTPQLAVVAAVAGRLLAGRPSVVDQPQTGNLSLLGVLAVIPAEEVSLALQASYKFPVGGRWTLIDAVAPLEARWPVGSSDWFVHLGTDRSRAPGPIRATVLPELLPRLFRAEAFLMVHGDGLTGLPISTAAQGLVVAAGVEVDTTLVAFPAIAEIHAAGMLAVSTRPTFLAGRAEVGGRLRLGPFALGVSAGLDLQVGPGSTYAAKLRICGEIDLWLIEISGCVHLSLGSQQQATPDPPVSPVAEVVVCDHRGAAVTARQDGVPVCWPDATIQVGFAPAPSAAGLPPGRFTIGAAPYTPSGDVGLGSAYEVHYDLTQLDLAPVDGAHPMPSNLPAQWQTKPGQHAVPGDGAAVLALLTHDNALWTGHLVDGGKDDPSTPDDARKHDCLGLPWRPLPGWAVGGAASLQAGDQWLVPPLAESGPASSLRSQVRAHAVTAWTYPPPLWAGPAARAHLPLGAIGVLGRVVHEEVDAELTFPGWLELPDLGWSEWPEVFEPPVTELLLTDPITEGRLLLLTPAESRTSVEVEGWQQDDRWPGPRGGFLEWWSRTGETGAVRIRHAQRAAPGPEGPYPDEGFQGIGVVALGGVTATARRRGAQVDDERPFGGRSPVPPVKAPPDRGPLREGQRYRVTVGWHGGAHAGGVTAEAGGSPSWEFTVADVVDTPPTGSDLHLSTAVFHPTMLARHLRGYRPDGAAPWFPDDAVATVLDRSGLTVAHAYGLTPTLVVLRTDVPEAVPLGLPQVRPELHDLLTAHEVLETAGMPYERCALPHGPVRLSAPAGLRTDAQYDVTVGFLRHDDTEFAGGRLPPAAFHTSHWRNPAAMFADAGFGPDANPSAVAVTVVPGPLPAVGGAASDGLLGAALGPVSVPPLAGPIRCTLVLSPDAGGERLVAGVLLECREPLERGRALSGITVQAADLGGTWTSVSDRPRTGILFRPPQPMATTTVRLGWSSWGTRTFLDLAVPWTPAAETMLALAGGSHG